MTFSYRPELRRETLASDIALWVKALATKLNDLSLLPRTSWWKEKISSCELSSELHTNAVEHVWECTQKKPMQKQTTTNTAQAQADSTVKQWQDAVPGGCASLGCWSTCQTHSVEDQGTPLYVRYESLDSPARQVCQISAYRRKLR